MGKKLNILDRRFGRLVVIAEGNGCYTKSGIHQTTWICQCDCGNIVEMRTTSLVNQGVQSCGCIKKEILIERNKRFNEFVEMDGYYIGYDSHNNRFLFDIDDYEIVSQYCWSVSDKGYVTAHPTHNKKSIRLHRLVMGVERTSYPLVDHINNDPTDCRKVNLRFATHTHNHMNVKERETNTSGVTGVGWHKASGKWRARITLKGVEYYLGIFDTFEEAVEARRLAEENKFGEFAYAHSQEMASEYEVLV